MVIYKALSVSANLIINPETSGYVLSVHKDHLNISLPEGIVTLQRCGTPLIPFGIEVDKDEYWDLQAIESGCPVVYRLDALIINDYFAVQGIAKCARHSSRPCLRGQADPEELLARLSLLDRLCRESDKPGGIRTYLEHYHFEDGVLNKHPADGILKREIGRRFELLLAGIAQNDNFLINEGVHGFLGLGPGLTPSGDDFLVGFLCGITYLSTDNCQTGSAKLAQCLAQDAPLLTTALSAEYLRYAAHGCYHAYILRLLEAVYQDNEQDILNAAQDMLSLGHYSGNDLLLGFIYGGMSAIHVSKGETI